MTPREILESAQQAESTKGLMLNTWRRIRRYAAPNASSVEGYDQPGDRVDDFSRYDDTAVNSSDLLAGQITDNSTNKANQWFELEITRFRNVKEVTDWLEECAKLMADELISSNFYLTIKQLNAARVTFGTAGVIVEQKPLGFNATFPGLNFRFLPTEEFSFKIDALGLPSILFRRFKYTAAQAKQFFDDMGGHNGLGEHIEAALKDTKAATSDEFEFIHMIAPRTTPGVGRKGMPWASFYVAVKDKHLIREGGYEEQPFALPRYDANTSDKGWGRSPVMKAMASILKVNRMSALAERAAEKDLDPPWRTDDAGVVGSVQLDAGSVMYVRPDATFDQLISNRRTDITQFQITETREEIRNMMLTGPLERLIASNEGQPRTATERRQNLEIAYEILGSTFERLSEEGTDIMLRRIFNMMVRGGAMPDPPEAVLEAQANGVDLDLLVAYKGGLALSVRAREADATEGSIHLAGVAAEMTGEKVHRLNVDKAFEHISKLRGVPGHVMRTDDEVEELREADAQALAESQALQQGEQVANIAGSVNAQAG